MRYLLKHVLLSRNVPNLGRQTAKNPVGLPSSSLYVGIVLLLITSAFSNYSSITPRDKTLRSRLSDNSNTIASTVGVGSSTFPLVRIPSQSDFTERGVVVEPGACGEWDWWLQGPSAVIKHGGTYFLYYIGMDGDRNEGPCDDSGDERNRYLGVAASQDGRTFTKHSASPIIRHQPTGGIEAGLSGEGGVLMGASPGVIDGKFILYLGGMEETSYETVDSDIVYYESTDGINFSKQSDAGDHRKLAAYRDENFPVGAFEINGTYHVYYTGQNGGDANWSLQVLSSTDPANLGSVSRKVSGPGDGNTKGQMGDVIRLADDRILFIHRDVFWPDGPIYVRSASVTDPTDLTTLEATWEWKATDEGGVVSEPKLFLDRQTGEWMLFYRFTPNDGSGSTSQIRLKTAPVTYQAHLPIEDEDIADYQLTLQIPRPNPAHSNTVARFATPRSEQVSLAMYDTIGRQRKFYQLGTLPGGRHEYHIDVSNLESGAYFLQLRAGGSIRTQRMLVVR